MKHPYFKSLANKNRKTPFTLKDMKKDFFDIARIITNYGLFLLNKLLL